MRSGPEWDQGEWGEREVRAYLERSGQYVVPASLIDNGGAPMAISLVRANLVLPDVLTIGGGGSAWWEVKTKTVARKYQKTGAWRHGHPELCRHRVEHDREPRVALARPPHHDRDPAVVAQHPVHLAQCQLRVDREHQAVATDHAVVAVVRLVDRLQVERHRLHVRQPACAGTSSTKSAIAPFVNS